MSMEDKHKKNEYSKKEIGQLKEDALTYVWPFFHDNIELAKKKPKIFVKGEGLYVYDIEGNRYLDSFASLLTTVSGHGRKEVADAVYSQMKELEFFPNYIDTFTVPVIKLAKKLAEITPGKLSVTFFVNDGSEACETAIKMAKQYFWMKGKKQKNKVIAKRSSYHGATYGGISACGLPWFREPFEPLTPGFIHVMHAWCYRCELNLNPETCKLACLKNIEQAIQWENPDTIAALIMDPLPGSNTGYPNPPEGYIKGIRKLCNKYKILLIFDEVQSGFGKTGKMFACEHWGVVPDIMAIAKGFSGGYLPLGATITTKKIADEFFNEPGKEFRHGFTFGGHPASCAAALANIKIIQKENLVENASKMGKYIREELENLKNKYSIIGDIRGMGLLLAVELVKDKKTKERIDPKLGVGTWMKNRFYEKNIILRNNGEILVLAPALTISKKEADIIITALDEVLSDAVKHFNLK
jgi:adenosylmethionine-8-amino-7-oxononanoate aminotransferase